MSDVMRWRALLGESTVLWAGPGGFRANQSGWLALSGVKSVDYNIALCHGSSQSTGLRHTLEEVTAAGVPAIVMVAGEALADVGVLVEANWICIGATSLMARGLRGGESDEAVRRLKLDELPCARGLVQEAFDLPAELSAVALPDALMSTEGQALWGLFEGEEMVSCTAFVRVQEASVGWSVATPPRFRHRGRAARLLRGVLAQNALEGATISLVYASARGEALYRELGFHELERWQMWSRPRWVLARA
jgi:hypothetical protein